MKIHLKNRNAHVKYTLKYKYVSEKIMNIKILLWNSDINCKSSKVDLWNWMYAKMLLNRQKETSDIYVAVFLNKTLNF